MLGVAVKWDVDDARSSRAMESIELLGPRKIDVVYHDPYVSEDCVNGRVLRTEPLIDRLVTGAEMRPDVNGPLLHRPRPGGALRPAGLRYAQREGSGH